jgi:hypothetical protein
MSTLDLTEAMQPLRAMLAADGYALEVSRGADGRTIVLEVTATGDACADCLAPPAVIAAVARDCVPADSPLAGGEIDVRLPPSSGSGSH